MPVPDVRMSGGGRMIVMIARMVCPLIFLALLAPVALLSDPVPPIEPKAPVEDVVREGEKAAEKLPDRANKVYEYNAVVFHAGGNRLRATLCLKENTIAAAYRQGGRTRVFRGEIAKVKSIEFREWKAVKEGKGRLYCPAAATITLDDGSVFVCGPLEMFRKFEVRRGERKSFAHSCWYVNESRQPRKSGGKKKKQVTAVHDHSAASPHPDTVTGIRFTHDERKSGVEDLLPMIFK